LLKKLKKPRGVCSKVTTSFQRALQGLYLEESLLFEALIKCQYWI